MRFLLSRDRDEERPHPHLHSIPVSGSRHIGHLPDVGRGTPYFGRGRRPGSKPPGWPARTCTPGLEEPAETGSTTILSEGKRQRAIPALARVESGGPRE